MNAASQDAVERGAVDREIRQPVKASGGGEELPEVLTVEEVARLLRVNAKTVREHFNAGLLPGQRIGQKIIRFHRDTVLEWLRGRRCDARSSRRTT